MSRRVPLGDYFSWAMRDGKNLILTIQSNYYYLDGDYGVMPAGHGVRRAKASASATVR